MTTAKPKVSVLLVDDDIDLLDSLEILVEASEHLDLAGRALTPPTRSSTAVATTPMSSWQTSACPDPTGSA